MHWSTYEGFDGGREGERLAFFCSEHKPKPKTNFAARALAGEKFQCYMYGFFFIQNESICGTVEITAPLFGVIPQSAYRDFLIRRYR